jgi:hypothetical protein
MSKNYFATFNGKLQNAKNYGDKKETVRTVQAVGMLNGKLACVAEARFYMGRRSDGASPVYCSLWVHGDNYTSGTGSAGGFGYHKQSAALQAAMKSAGVFLWADAGTHAYIDGVGDGAMRDAMTAIAIAAGADPANILILD